MFYRIQKYLPIQLYNNLNEDKYEISFLLDLESKFLKKCNLDNNYGTKLLKLNAIILSKNNTLFT